MPISGSVDLGRSGHSAFSILIGDGWDRIKLVHMESHASIMATDVEKHLVRLHAQWNPACWVIEANGPGGVFCEFASQNHPYLPIYSVDVSQQPSTLYLWDSIVFNDREYLNWRACEYFILRYMLRAGKLKFAFEDAELFSQLCSTFWDVDKSRGEKIRIMPKRNMKINNYTSELEGIQFSRSPDKADSLALACLGYAILMQDDIADARGKVEEEIIQPAEGFEGMFNLFDAGIEVE